MPIELFETKSPRSVIADWVELKLLASDKLSLSSALVERAESVRGEPVHGKEFDEDSDIEFELEITDSPAETVVDDIWQEIIYRQETLKDLYPFEIQPRGTGWTLTLRGAGDEPTRVARNCYIACLLVSAMRLKLLPSARNESDYYDDLYQSAPDAFQAISYLSASKILGGQAFWFGWPRISETPKYTDALAAIVESIGLGKLKSTPPDWSTNSEKDGTVDIVAWRSFLDKRYGSIVLYGQVASGANWRDKPISSYIKGHFLDWFEDEPSASYLQAMFIPFLLHHDIVPKAGTPFDDAARAAARRDSADFGTILDRLRLTELAFSRGSQTDNGSDLYDLGAKVYRWTAKAKFYAKSETIPT